MKRWAVLTLVLLGPCVTIDSERNYNVYMQADGQKVDVLVEKTEDIRPQANVTGEDSGNANAAGLF